MNKNVKIALRTLQTNFPFLLDTKFAFMRIYRKKLGILHEADFGALSFFPDTCRTLFLDVGANRGQSTDSMLMKTKNARIQLFEPNPLLSTKLELLYRGNERVCVHGFGLGNDTAEHDLYVPYYKKWMFDGLASLDREEARTWLKGRVFFYKERYLTVREVRTKIRPLDELELDPFFIKLDIQGYECQALKGGENTLKIHEPILLIESPDERTTNYLETFGYRCYAFRRGTFIPDIFGELNTFFMTESKAVFVKGHIARA